MNRGKSGRGYFILSVCLLLFPFIAAAQSNSDLRLGYQPLVCVTDTSATLRVVTIENQCIGDSRFTGGTFHIQWGDGKEENWGNAKQLTHEYPAYATYTMNFSWRSADGTKALQKEFEVTLKRAPVAGFTIPSAGSCVNLKTVFQITGYNEESPETEYIFTYEGRELGRYSQDYVRAHEGVINYVFREKMCEQPITMTMRNQCVEEGFVTENSTQNSRVITVLTPAVIDFRVEPEPVCTENPFDLVIDKSRLGVCGARVDYAWELEERGGYTGENPEIAPYDKPGDYEIKLVAKVAGYTCANDTVKHTFRVIKHVETDFSLAADTLCYDGTPFPLQFTNLSTGDSIQNCIWTVNGNVMSRSATKTDFSYTITGEGVYRINLYMDNGCSSDSKDTTVIVRRSPEIAYFALTDGEVMCPSSAAGLQLDMSDYIAYSWFGNPEEAQWTITPEEGVSYVAGYGADHLYPRVTLQPGKTYELKVELKGVKVGGTVCGTLAKRTMTKHLKVSDPAIVKEIIPDQAPGADGKIRICQGGQLSFTNHSTGEDLKHHWTITPVAGAICEPGKEVRFLSGSATSAAPVFKFPGYGEFILTDTLSVYCGSLPVSFHVHVGKAPTISVWTFGADTLICSGQTLDMNDYVYCDWYNNEHLFEWKFEPHGPEGDRTQNYPEIRFPAAGKYTLTLELTEKSCPDADTRSVASIDIRVRETNLQCEVITEPAGVVYCEKQRLRFINKAKDIEGNVDYSWKIIKKDGEEKVPESRLASISEQFNEYGDYKVIGSAIGYCDVKSDSVEFTIHKNPKVELRDTTMCPGNVKMENFVTYEWYNNTDRTVSWEVNGPVDGYEGELHIPYPEFLFKKKGDYVLTATIPGPGCPEGQEGLQAEKTYHVYDTVIYGEIVMKGLDGVTTPGDICEGQAVTFENTTTAEASIAWNWWVEGGQEGGYQFADGESTSEQQMPVITFLKYGDYVVKVKVIAACRERIWSFPVVVRGIPEIVLQEKMEKICAGDGQAVDLSRYLTYTDRKNSVIHPAWSVSPSAGVSWENGYGEEADFPHMLFQEAAHYVVTLVASSKCAEGGKQEFHTSIDVIRQHLDAVFSVGKDSVGCTDDPTPYLIHLQNQSDGDSLTYQWQVIPENAAGGNYTFEQGNASSLEPVVLLSEPGFYQVRLQVKNICGEDDSVFRVQAFARPEIEIEDVSAVCEPYIFSGNYQIEVKTNNDVLRQAEWEIVPDLTIGNGGAAYLPGFSASSFYPEIEFRHGLYRIRVKYYNRCQTPGVHEFSIRADEFIPIEPLADQEICELSAARLLTAHPEGGEWTIRDAALLPQAEQALFRDEGGNYYFHPVFGAYEQKDIELIYRKDNGSCIARDTMNMRVWPLPYTEAGDPLEMCLNHDPQLLIGLDSASGMNWQENRGQWRMNDEALEEHLFKALVAGDFNLRYYYTDRHGCTNHDSVVMTVHPLPMTDFKVARKSCIHTAVDFVPVDPLNHTFEWDFGDGSPHGWSTGEIQHTYDGYGYRNVICMAESQYHCRDTSAEQQIEIVNLPPPAFFDINTLGGCPPFHAIISVDKEVYKDDHNYLSFHWDYGEGTQTDTLGPIVPKYYQASDWDTTYVTRFTVSNMCDTVSYDTTINVYSAPKVSFALMHEWECDPVLLELQNTTTGNKCVFDWTFTNGRTGEVVKRTAIRNPVYEFTTDSASTVYYITLKAVNSCDEDIYTDSLTVKPRSISAHFTPLAHAYACVNEELFFRNNSTDTVASILNTHWSFGDGGQDNQWSPRHRYEAAGEYIVSLKIDNGCGWDTVSSVVNIYPLPALEIRSEDYLCEEDTFTFVLRSDQQLSYIEWKLGDGNAAHKDSIRYRYDGYGHYQVTVTGVSAEINQCTDSVKKEVTIYNKPIMQILPLDTALCSPLLYRPEVTGEAFLMWDYGDGSELTSAPEHRYENESDTVEHFKVVAYAETDKGCKSEYERQVILYNNPRAGIDKDVVHGNPQKVTFINLSEEYTDCIWELPDHRVVHTAGDQLVEFGEGGTYSVRLIAVNYLGCRDTVEMEHEVLIKGLYFPNTFIPHSLNGKVNRFNGIGIGLQEYKLEIFDSYGNKVWETTALERGRPSEGWDGCNTKGKLMPQGMYIWRAKAIFGDSEVWTGKNNESGVPQTTQGTVLLLRE